MNDDDIEPSTKSWFSRLLQVLHRDPHNRDELIEILQNAKERQLLNDDAFIMIEGVLNVSTIQVRDIMVPRGRMVVFEHDEKPHEIIPRIIKSTHSRFPVIGENRDEVLGILLAKDLLQFLHHDSENPMRVQDLIRPAVFIPESKRIDVLLHEFRNNRYHMAIVVDEYGGVSGLVTIEDVLEQIVGNIEDETDIANSEPNIQEIDRGVFQVKALTTINEFNQYFLTKLSDDDYDTIGGYVMQEIGHIPKRGESFTLGKYTVIVTQASKRRITEIRMIRQQT